MKKILCFALFLCMGLTAVSAKNTVSRTLYENSSITGVSASLSFEVEVIYSENTRVEIELPEEMTEYLDTRLDGGILHLSLKNKKGRNRCNFKNNSERPKARVYTNQVSQLSASTSANISCKGEFTGDKIKIGANTSGKISFEKLSGYKTADISVNTSGRINGTLYADNLKCGANTSGSITLEHYGSQTNAHANTSGRISLKGTCDSCKKSSNTSGKIHTDDYTVSQ